MEKVNCESFFNNLDVMQLTQWFQKESSLFKNFILPNIILEPGSMLFTQFITLEGETKIHMSADILYENHGKCVSRNIRQIKTYKDEMEMEFYMVLLEYENTIDANPVLFNAVGTREDAIIESYDFSRVVARHVLFSFELN
jgi:hypothetical protein